MYLSKYITRYWDFSRENSSSEPNQQLFKSAVQKVNEKSKRGERDSSEGTRVFSNSYMSAHAAEHGVWQTQGDNQQQRAALFTRRKKARRSLRGWQS